MSYQYQDTQQRPKHNPNARDPDDVLGTELPDTVSAATWMRPYEYLVVRTDDDRITRMDDHELGRSMSGGLHTRHNAVGRKAVLERRDPDAEYRIVAEPNENYQPEEYK